MDLNSMGLVFTFNSREERAEPFQRSKVTADPEEVDLAQTGLGAPTVSHAVPDGLQDRGEWRHADTRTDEQHGLEFEHVFRGRTERPVDVQAREDFREGCLVVLDARS